MKVQQSYPLEWFGAHTTQYVHQARRDLRRLHPFLNVHNAVPEKLWIESTEIVRNKTEYYACSVKSRMNSYHLFAIFLASPLRY